MVKMNFSQNIGPIRIVFSLMTSSIFVLASFGHPYPIGVTVMLGLLGFLAGLILGTKFGPLAVLMFAVTIYSLSFMDETDIFHKIVLYPLFIILVAFVHRTLFRRFAA